MKQLQLDQVCVAACWSVCRCSVLLQQVVVCCSVLQRVAVCVVAVCCCSRSQCAVIVTGLMRKLHMD